jgi:Na+-translocating ferredoxin:NAD+ oxidoreductase RnfG subunit
MRDSRWLLLPAATVLATPAYAVSYLTVAQAQAAMFPGETLEAIPVTLTDEQVAAIQKASGVEVTSREVHAWKAPGGGWFLLDEVIGKHEAIGFAVGLKADGSVKQVEVLDYREAYGWEIRNEKWRRQFVGKTAADPVLLDKDIRNISGATLSSRHLTEGVKRLLATHAVVLK